MGHITSTMWDKDGSYTFLIHITGARAAITTITTLPGQGGRRNGDHIAWDIPDEGMTDMTEMKEIRAISFYMTGVFT